MAFVDPLFTEPPPTDMIALSSLDGGANLRLLVFTIYFEEILRNPDYSSPGGFISSLTLTIACAALSGKLTFIELLKA